MGHSTATTAHESAIMDFFFLQLFHSSTHLPPAMSDCRHGRTKSCWPTSGKRSLQRLLQEFSRGQRELRSLRWPDSEAGMVPLPLSLSVHVEFANVRVGCGEDTLLQGWPSLSDCSNIDRHFRFFSSKSPSLGISWLRQSSTCPPPPSRAISAIFLLTSLVVSLKPSASSSSPLLSAAGSTTPPPACAHFSSPSTPTNSWY